MSSPIRAIPAAILGLIVLAVVAAAIALQPKTSHDNSGPVVRAETEMDDRTSERAAMPMSRNRTAVTPQSRATTPSKRSGLPSAADSFRAESDPYKRTEIAESIGASANAGSANLLLDLLLSESDQDVRNALHAALRQSSGTATAIPEIGLKLQGLYGASAETEERVNILHTAAELATPESAGFLRDVFSDPKCGPVERVSAAVAISRLAQLNPGLVPQSESIVAIERLRSDMRTAADASSRREAITAISQRNDPNDKALFLELLATETDPSLKMLLEKLTL